MGARSVPRVRGEGPIHTGDSERAVLHGGAAERVAGTRSGSLFAYQGQPAWLFMTVRGPVPPGRYTVEITDRHSARYLLATGIDLSQTHAWGGKIPVAVHDVSVVRVTESERLVFSARLATQ